MLGLLVLSVLIFTSFFREDDGGLLHRVKGTVGAVFAPVQEGATAAVQPLKDGWNWFADLRGAAAERDRLAKENEALRSQIVGRDVLARQNAEFREQLAIAGDGPDGYRAVAARVVVRPPDLSRKAQLDKGRSDGIVPNSLVLAAGSDGDGAFGALVGRITEATATSSTVTFLTDPSTQVGATMLRSDKPLGLLSATPSGDLILDKVPPEVEILEGDVVVTAGFGTQALQSPYPPGLPIGSVRNTGTARGEPGEFQTVQVAPFRDPLELTTLMVWVPDSAQAKRRAGG